jgi:hypothetical protein
MLVRVHRRPPPSANSTNTIRANTGERPRTGVNETETETSIPVRHCTDATQHAGSSARDGLDALQLPELFLVVGCLVEVERELAIQPELGGGAKRLGQPQRR